MTDEQLDNAEEQAQKLAETYVFSASCYTPEGDKRKKIDRKVREFIYLGIRLMRECIERSDN